MKRTSIHQCDAQSVEHGNFAFQRKRLGAAVGAKGLGTSWFEILPGKKAFPFHFHLANEEAVYILEGEGTLRTGGGFPPGTPGGLPGPAAAQPGSETPLHAGDYIVFAPGPPAHQIVNTSQAPLRYLAISTMLEPEVAIYPDSKKLGVLARSHAFTVLHKDEHAVDDYYEGEE